MNSGFQDPYMDPGASVLRNKLGLTDRTELALAEEKFSRLRTQELAMKGVTGVFDLDHFASVHAYLFQDVYSWAGQVRTINIAKGGTTFEKSSRIPAALDGIHQSLKSENFLKNLERVEFARRLAHYYKLWNAVHPFREGNGRSTRMMMGQLASNAGWILDVTRIDNREGQWNEASKRSFNGDLSKVTEVLTHAVRDPRSVVFEHAERAFALRLFPDLDQAFAASDTCRAVAIQGGMTGKALDVFCRTITRELCNRLDAGVRRFSPADFAPAAGPVPKPSAPKPRL